MVYDIWDTDTSEKVAENFNEPFAIAVLREHGFGEEQATEFLSAAAADPNYALVRAGMTVLAKEVE